MSTAISSSSPRNQHLPIFKLYPDILWKIFLMNADMNSDGAIRYKRPGEVVEDGRALTVTRQSSQVCQLWRNIIMESPSLWGKVIDLDVLQRKKYTWMNEVIRRSAQSMLRVKGTYLLQDPIKQELITPLLDDHWGRIQRLDFRIHQRDNMFVGEILRLVKRPAKALESFDIYFAISALSGPPPIPSLTAGHVFFAASAPSLRKFRWTYFDFNINIQGSWLSQLYTLSLASLPRQDIAYFLNALAEMPPLQSLTLDMSIAPPKKMEVAQNRISLPRLELISMTDTLQACASFVDNIDPLRGCLLRLYSALDDLSNDDMNFASRALRRYSWSYFDTNHATSLFLHLYSWQLDFFDGTPPIYPSLSPSNFGLTFTDPGEGFPTSSLSMFISSFAACRYNNVTSLRFRCHHPTLDPSDANFKRLLFGLSSLTIMDISEEALEALLSGDEDTAQVAFPNLRTLICEVENTGSVRLRNHDSNSPILRFLISRRDAGVSIETLDFTRCTDFRRDMRFLEEMSGLKVIWNATQVGQSYTEYVCGSGSPEMLILSCT